MENIHPASKSISAQSIVRSPLCDRNSVSRPDYDAPNESAVGSQRRIRVLRCLREININSTLDQTMGETLLRVKLGLVGVISIPVVFVIMRAGLAEGGPWSPFEAAAVAIAVVAIFLFKATEAELSTRQGGVALALLLLLVLGMVVVNAILTGECVSRALLGKFGMGLAVAAVFIGWPFLSGRGDE